MGACDDKNKVIIGDWERNFVNSCTDKDIREMFDRTWDTAFELGKMYERVKSLVSNLYQDEQQLLQDTIKHGAYTDDEFEFVDIQGNFETAFMRCYITSNAKKAGRFNEKEISFMFRNIYTRLCPYNRHRTGNVISHCKDWLGIGNGNLDMLFIRKEWVDAFEYWAHND